MMKALHDKVNIVPVIAKADTLTKKEVKKLKERVSLSSSLFRFNLSSLQSLIKPSPCRQNLLFASSPEFL